MSRRSDRQRGWNRSTVRQFGIEIIRESADCFLDLVTYDGLRATCIPRSVNWMP
ncbi:hypothetical protein ACUXZZ_43845 [Streptomyces graminifolii]|uniref:hypothetical protein n=1 Tax=Streptomyces graminifolii TaxID=1266771 RepID=UPI0040595EBA